MPEPSLSEVDWRDAAWTARALEDALRRFARPDRLAGLLRSARTDPRLLGLSEVRPWGNRMVLYEDPSSGARLRLQHWAGGDKDPHGRPHNHRWAFASTILHGSYVHRLYGEVADVERRLAEEGGPARPLLERTESAGSSYVLPPQTVHSATAAAGTVSLLLRGPAVGEYAVRLNRDLTAFAERKGGVASEGRTERPERPFGTADADCLGTLLSSLGLLD
ncbi:hypothetical protein ACF1GT_21120 [Streptomyces sp. NPDC014636]|uniref:hypothetical protein n=1 Tax=Streptomyces sp. NPDC014636 TaxID=3364876 RepID=UPI003701A802